MKHDPRTLAILVRPGRLAVLAAAAGLVIGLAYHPVSAAPLTAALNQAAPPAEGSLLIEVKKGRGHVHAHLHPRTARHINHGAYRPGRAWSSRHYYGDVVAGVALGTAIGVGAAGVVPRRPAPHLCWYWNDPTRTRGHWDYC